MNQIHWFVSKRVGGYEPLTENYNEDVPEDSEESEESVSSDKGSECG